MDNHAPLSKAKEPAETIPFEIIETIEGIKCNFCGCITYTLETNILANIYVTKCTKCKATTALYVYRIEVCKEGKP